MGDTMKFFVLGNGSSLAKMNLDLLQGEKTVAINRINLVYDKFAWRPTIYCKSDHNPYLADVYNEENILNVSVSEKSYLWEDFKDGDSGTPHRKLPVGMGDHPKVTWIKRCKHHYYAANNHMKRTQSWHLPEICTALSGIGVAMQVAVLEGATEIYLIGCDLGYGKDIGQDHFDPRYSLTKKKLGQYEIDNVSYCHEVAKRSSPVPIYNAGIGGDLEVYPRVDFMEVLREKVI